MYLKDNRARVSLFLAGGIALLVGTIVALASNGAIQISGPWQVSQNTCCYWRFEPSSTPTSSTWVQSWMELPNTSSYTGWTGSWGSVNGVSQWTGLVNHGSIQDLFLALAQTDTRI
jgi:hypothetical protein